LATESAEAFAYWTMDQANDTIEFMQALFSLTIVLGWFWAATLFSRRVKDIYYYVAGWLAMKQA
jgi:hypothetical protein